MKVRTFWLWALFTKYICTIYTVYCFFTKNQSNFLPLPCKLDNPYYRRVYLKPQDPTLVRDIFCQNNCWNTPNIFWQLVNYTGKSLSEALILVATNPQYDPRLFIELRVQYMKTTSSEHVVYTNCFFVLTFKIIYVHNMFWACTFHVLNSYFNEQSFVILWVSWW